MSWEIEFLSHKPLKKPRRLPVIFPCSVFTQKDQKTQDNPKPFHCNYIVMLLCIQLITSYNYCHSNNEMKHVETILQHT